MNTFHALLNITKQLTHLTSIIIFSCNLGERLFYRVHIVFVALPIVKVTRTPRPAFVLRRLLLVNFGLLARLLDRAHGVATARVMLLGFCRKLVCRKENGLVHNARVLTLPLLFVQITLNEVDGAFRLLCIQTVLG